MQKVRISKQTTFIVIVFTLMLGYVLFAYRTMINKNNTDSRASMTKKESEKVATKIVLPNCDIEYCEYINRPVIDKQNNIQFINIDDSTVDPKANYLILTKRYDEVGSKSKLIKKVLGSKLKSELQKVQHQDVGLRINNIDEHDFLIYRIESPLDKIPSY